MFINSLLFVLIVSTIAVLNYFLPKRARPFLLFVSSVLFIAVFQWQFLLPAFTVTTVTYFSAKALDGHFSHRQSIFIAASTINLLLLCYYKFFGFFLENYLYISETFGIYQVDPVIEVLMPLGISYYVFQAVGYLAEVYWKKEQAEKSFINLSVYLLFFPKIIAGPIERSGVFLNRLKGMELPSVKDVHKGVGLLLYGLFKKIVVADRLDEITSKVFESPVEFAGWPLAFTSVLLVVQLYADLSGYTDMALGGARLIGIRLTDNFNRPFLANSVAGFWRRWHITLSTWVADYVFRPLSLYFTVRKGWAKGGIVLALLISFLLIGIWHGDRWTFVIFGSLQGVAISLELMTGKWLKKSRILFLANKVFVTNILTITFFAFTCILFLAENVDEAVFIAGHLSGSFSVQEFIGLVGIRGNEILASVSLAVFFIIVDHSFSIKNTTILFGKAGPYMRYTTYALFLIFTIMLSAVEAVPFIYQRF